MQTKTTGINTKTPFRGDKYDTTIEDAAFPMITRYSDEAATVSLMTAVQRRYLSFADENEGRKVINCGEYEFCAFGVGEFGPFA
jgi:hypothetical protein